MSQAIHVSELVKRRCAACRPGTPALAEGVVRETLRQMPGWALIHGEVVKTFEFANYHETIAFVNAAAWVSHREDHHPDLEVGYKRCRVRYSTHSIGGISENDLICAAKVEGLVGAA
jgi:4a-hydroxytetrahydrobiopterin dehydratase